MKVKVKYNSNEPFGSVKGGEFNDWLRTIYKVLKTESAPWSCGGGVSLFYPTTSIFRTTPLDVSVVHLQKVVTTLIIAHGS
jgi:hypothetical protein